MKPTPPTPPDCFNIDDYNASGIIAPDSPERKAIYAENGIEIVFTKQLKFRP